MLIVPGFPPLQQTRHSRELSKRVEQLVRDFQRDHPELTEDEVRAALMASAPAGDAPEVVRRKRAFAVGMVAATVGAFVAVASNSGELAIRGVTWQIVGAVLAVCAVVIAAVVLVRRA